MVAAATPVMAPFVVLVDSAEGDPYTFEGLQADSRQGSRPLIVQTQWQPLGRHPQSFGDYSIENCVGRVAVERKSMDDCWSTVLGFSGGRRERFEQELANLATAEAAVVVVESSMESLLAEMPKYGVKSREHNQKTFFRSIIAWQQRYPVQWMFAGNRTLAEVYTFRYLEKFWNDEQKRIKLLAAGQSLEKPTPMPNLEIPSCCVGASVEQAGL